MLNHEPFSSLPNRFLLYEEYFMEDYVIITTKRIQMTANEVVNDCIRRNNIVPYQKTKKMIV